MKSQKLNILFLVSAIVALTVLSSCEKEPDIPRQNLIVNNWIWDGMNDFYLWEASIPALNPNAEPEPGEFFYKILFEDDRNSRIYEDYETARASSDGVEMTTGMSVEPTIYTETQVVSFVQYVVPGTPAADSGIARGDIILTINGQTLTKDNYYSLYFQNTATFGFGEWDGNEITPNGREITLTATTLGLNPVQYHKVINYGDRLIGYLVYTQFTKGINGIWIDSLNAVFEEFRTAGVSDVIMDVRYNPGGDLDLTSYIASTLVPSSVMENEAVFLELVWNEVYNDFWAG